MKQISAERRVKVMQHIYSITSVKILKHWCQVVAAKGLCMYRAMPTVWSSLAPRRDLKYDLSILSCPVALISGGSDSLIDAHAAREAVEEVCVHAHIEPDYEHMDLLWADNMPEKIFPVLSSLLEKYNVE